jgi:hypothetical protein
MRCARIEGLFAGQKPRLKSSRDPEQVRRLEDLQGRSAEHSRSIVLFHRPVKGAHPKYGDLLSASIHTDLTAIMRHMAGLCMSGERARAGNPTGWVGVMPLAVRCA